jgi:chaperonin GroEL
MSNSLSPSPKIIHSADAARQALLRGVNILADAVGATIGPRGRNIVLPGPHPGATPISSRDGVTVAKAIDLADPSEQAGVLLLRAVAAKTVDLAGDGTSTATILARAIYADGLKLVASGVNPTALKRGIDRATTLIIGTRDSNNLPVGGILTTLSSPVSGDMITQVGTISANGDQEIGAILAEAMTRVGASGVVTVEESKSLETTLDVVEGMQFDRGYLSPYFVTDTARMEASYDQPAVLICARKLTSMKTAQELAEFLAQHLLGAGAARPSLPNPRPLLIIADEIESDIIGFLVANKIQAGVPVVAVKAPGHGDRRAALLADLAALTGATVIGDELGLTFKQATYETFGSAARVTVDKDSTTISGGGGGAALAQRIDEIRSQIEKSESAYDRIKLEERLAKLTGGVAVIKVGAPTEAEMKEKKDRVEDAMYATRAAVAEGIVPGGGVALLRAAYSDQFAEMLAEITDHDERAGALILQRACSAPLRQIVKNAGGDESDVVGNVLHPERFGKVACLNFGYNAATGEYQNLVVAGVIDPTKVTRTALQSAASIAGLMLTTEAVVVDDQAALKELAQMRAGQPQMPGMY